VTAIVDLPVDIASAALASDRLHMLPALSLDEAVDKVAQRLADEFSPSFPDQTVRRLVDEVYGEFAAAKVTQFVPVLVDRGVRARIRAQAQSAPYPESV
jgi:hypothetical protein